MSSSNLDTYLNVIRVSDKLTSIGLYKIVDEIPPFKCSNYLGEQGFRIQVGKHSFVNIPVWWLDEAVLESKAKGDVFNKAILEIFAKKEVKNKPCLVHAVGGILVKAGIAKQISARNYKIII